MTAAQTTVANVALSNVGPTDLALNDLHNWVIWQFPRKREKGMCGAVHPPMASYGWFPAIIYAQEEKIQVHGHLDKTFSSPEAAHDYLNGNDT